MKQHLTSWCSLPGIVPVPTYVLSSSLFRTVASEGGTPDPGFYWTFTINDLLSLVRPESRGPGASLRSWEMIGQQEVGMRVISAGCLKKMDEKP